MSIEVMPCFSEEEISKAQKQIISIITRCEKAQLKFSEGTSQHTLLKNRLQAMYIANSLLASECSTYTKEELERALEPIASIVRKCSKAQQNSNVGTPHYNRLQKLMDAMQLATACIHKKINMEAL